MKYGQSNRRWSVFLLTFVAVTGAALAAERTWTSLDGKLDVKAEFVALRGDTVVLRRKDGEQITILLKQLSDEDRAFVESQPDRSPKIDIKAAIKEMTKSARQFFSDLRDSDRDVALKLLTEKAQSLSKGENSPLALLPKPESGTSSIRTGKAEVDGSVAEVQVRVRAGRKYHKTKLHFRYEEEKWQIFAISATYPDGEKSINFEAEGVSQEKTDPLLALVGKPLELVGTTIDGRSMNMDDYQGKVVLVDFWATWCGPCRAEMPNIFNNFKKYHDDGFEVIAISVDQDMQALKSYLEKEQPPWTIMADNRPGNPQKMGAKYGIRGIPAFILVGKDGKVAAVNCRGPRLGRELSRLLDNSVSSNDVKQLR